MKYEKTESVGIPYSPGDGNKKYSEDCVNEMNRINEEEMK